MLVSVVIPCYNVASYITECLQALLQQSYKNLQIICVNNNSTDSTADILQKFALQYPQLIQIYNEPQKGAPYARNTGLEKALGVYVQFLDADDLLEPDKISHQVNLINTHSFPAIIAANYFRLALNGEKKLHQVNHHDFWLALLYTQLGITSANLFKTEEVKKVGGFDVTLKSSQEYMLMFEMMCQGAKVIYDSQPYTIIRDRKTGSISQQNRAENMERYLSIRILIVKYLEKQYNSEKMRPYYQALFDAIRIVYKHHKEAALKAYKENIPASFRPVKSATTSQSYINTFTLLGFKSTEKIKELLS